MAVHVGVLHHQIVVGSQQWGDGGQLVGETVEPLVALSPAHVAVSPAGHRPREWLELRRHAGGLADVLGDSSESRDAQLQGRARRAGDPASGDCMFSRRHPYLFFMIIFAAITALAVWSLIYFFNGKLSTRRPRFRKSIL